MFYYISHFPGLNVGSPLLILPGVIDEAALSWRVQNDPIHMINSQCRLLADAPQFFSIWLDQLFYMAVLGQHYKNTKWKTVRFLKT